MTIGESGSDDGQFNRPTGVTVDRDGDIYVADWANHRVQMFNSSGLFVEKFIGDATLSDQARGYMITNMMAMRLREMTAIEPQKALQMACVRDRERRWTHVRAGLWFAAHTDLPKRGDQARSGGDCPDTPVSFPVHAVLGTSRAGRGFTTSRFDRSYGPKRAGLKRVFH